MAFEVCSKLPVAVSGTRVTSFSFRHVHLSNLIKVMTAQGLHLFPFRTEKLNLATPMVLRKRESR